MAVCAELCEMMRNDLELLFPHDSAVRVCELAAHELSRQAVVIVDYITRESQVASVLKPSNELNKSVSSILKYIHTLITSINDKLAFCKLQELDLPPPLELTAPLTEDPNDLNLTQVRYTI